jgi:hypothetical protein
MNFNYPFTSLVYLEGCKAANPDACIKLPMKTGQPLFCEKYAQETTWGSPLDCPVVSPSRVEIDSTYYHKKVTRAVSPSKDRARERSCMLLSPTPLIH